MALAGEQATRNLQAAIGGTQQSPPERAILIQIVGGIHTTSQHRDFRINPCLSMPCYGAKAHHTPDGPRASEISCRA